MSRKAEAPVLLTGQRRIELSMGKGSFYYRVPNVIEQLRFFSQSGWYRDDTMKDAMLRILAGLEAAREYVTMVESEYYETFDDVLLDRDNMDMLIEFVNDIAGIKKRVTDDEKKP